MKKSNYVQDLLGIFGNFGILTYNIPKNDFFGKTYLGISKPSFFLKFQKPEYMLDTYM